MHVQERIAQVTVKRTIKNGENYESREFMLPIEVNNGSADAYARILETERGLSELLDEVFGDMAFEKDQKAPEEVVKETFPEAEELEIEEPEEVAEVSSGNIMHLLWDVWHDLSKKGKSIKLGNKDFPSGGGDYDDDINSTLWGYLREEYGSAKMKQEWSNAQRAMLFNEIVTKAKEQVGHGFKAR